MKVLAVLFILVALSRGQEKLFHEHFNDFLDVISKEVGDDLEQLLERYVEFDEFWVSLDYMATDEFKTLATDMQNLPEFKAVVDFLEKDNIDVTYFIDIFNDGLGIKMPRLRFQVSGKGFNSFIRDSIAILPKEKLAALFNQKMILNKEFRDSIANLKSEEWNTVSRALWFNNEFQAQMRTLNDHGIDLEVVLEQILAILGQN